MIATNSQRILSKDKFQILERLAQERRESNPELAMVMSKQILYFKGIKPEGVLKKHSLPPISSDYRKLLRTKIAEIDSRVIKDGYIYSFRGDYPGLEQKGIFSFSYYRWNVNLDQILELLRDEQLNNHADFRVRNKLEELMWIHSNGGYENFLSTTTLFRIARKHPKYKDNSGRVYVIRAPVNNAFRNYASVCSDDEQEIMIPDFILPNFIIAVIDPKKVRDLDIKEFIQK